ncbi:hypothetical protein [Halorubrum salinum]|uniref:hypothetical protein n=1 Tax=Halorubrum salinum TaxID=767517 RepID=UPI0021114A4F|nr:hypothetical protein [Halorubrum salinum]
MTLRKTAGKWIEEGGTLLLLAGLVLKLVFEIALTAIIAYPLSFILGFIVPLESLLEAAAGVPPDAPAFTVAGAIAGIFVFCRWNQTEATGPNALTERFGQWVNEMNDERS